MKNEPPLKPLFNHYDEGIPDTNKHHPIARIDLTSHAGCRAWVRPTRSRLG